MPQCVEERVDYRFLGEGLRLETVSRHPALEDVGTCPSAEHPFEFVVVNLLAEVRDRLVNYLDELVAFIFGDGRLEGLRDELGGYGRCVRGHMESGSANY